MTTPIKFGTDGWRGFIADDFTFDNVRRVAGAIAAYVLKHEDAARGIIVGYDTRYASDRAAPTVPQVLTAAASSPIPPSAARPIPSLPSALCSAPAAASSLKSSTGMKSNT